jgi:flagellar basal-body rod protein FlgB
VSSLDTPAIHALSRFLDAVAFRQRLVAQNIANIDTPGYRTKDIDFRHELRRALGGNSEPSVHEVPGLLQRPDGNNVNLDREGLLMGEMQLHFRTGVQLLRAELRRVLSAIQEGRS